MLAIEPGSRFASLTCPVCHATFRPGDRVLPSFRHGRPRAIHAGLCGRPAPLAPRPAAR